MGEASSVSLGGDFACALQSNQTVACWGDNRDGQLGDGTTTSRSTARTIPGLEGVVQVSAGTNFACALLATGRVSCWGGCENGQIGSYVMHSVTQPTRVTWPPD